MGDGTDRDLVFMVYLARALNTRVVCLDKTPESYIVHKYPEYKDNKSKTITRDEFKRFVRELAGNLFEIPDRSFKDIFSSVTKLSESKGTSEIGLACVKKWLENAQESEDGNMDLRFVDVAPKDPKSLKEQTKSLKEQIRKLKERNKALEKPLSFDKGHLTEPLLRVFRDSLGDNESWWEALGRDFGNEIDYKSFAQLLRDALAERFCRTSEKSCREVWAELDPVGDKCDIKNLADHLKNPKDLGKEYPCYPVAPFPKNGRNKQVKAELKKIDIQRLAYIDFTRYLLVAVAAFMLANALVVE